MKEVEVEAQKKEELEHYFSGCRKRLGQDGQDFIFCKHCKKSAIHARCAVKDDVDWYNSICGSCRTGTGSKVNSKNWVYESIDGYK